MHGYFKKLINNAYRLLPGTVGTSPTVMPPLEAAQGGCVSVSTCVWAFLCVCACVCVCVCACAYAPLSLWHPSGRMSSAQISMRISPIS